MNVCMHVYLKKVRKASSSTSFSSSSSSSSSYGILLLHLIPAGFSSLGSVVYNAYLLP